MDSYIAPYLGVYGYPGVLPFRYPTPGTWPPTSIFPRDPRAGTSAPAMTRAAGKAPAAKADTASAR